MALSVPITVATVIVRAAVGGEIEARSTVAIWTIALITPSVAAWGRPLHLKGDHYLVPRARIVSAGLVGVPALLLQILELPHLVAWCAAVVCLIASLLVGHLFHQPRRRLHSLVSPVLVSLLGAGTLLLVAEAQSQFAEEEFFVALQALVLTVLAVGVWSSSRVLARHIPKPALRGVTIRRTPVLLAVVLLGFSGGLAAVRSYQRSFYGLTAPAHAGVESASPFVCGQLPADTQVYDGVEVFDRLVERVKANPRKDTPEYGMLALATGDSRWAELFHSSLLAEASAGMFTEPANSVKYGQYEASLRAYYYPKMRAAFSELFTDQDAQVVSDWFFRVNARALTVGWVDVLYGLAFTKWPEGPYENQESGAGLLTLLEANGLADPSLSKANQDYLDRNRRGWSERFRNTDDSLVYQLEWINNAYFQSLYNNGYPKLNAGLSFEWLLLQALPGGERVGYNHVREPTLAGVSYLGATLLEDSRYIWLAGRSLDALEAQGEYLRAQPGVEGPVHIAGRAPAKGSCVLYSESGLPNQVGPLAPDKVVLRDGWEPGSAYALLNLRFTGWHRYKATGTVTLIHRGAPLIQDVAAGDPFIWLPEGRSLFRDKRIPRENLNGLLIPRVGVGAVTRELTGVGSPWAQDPPHYASVESFSAASDVSSAHVRIGDWHGWSHDRRVYLQHDGGPIAVLDTASSEDKLVPELSWHLQDAASIDGNRAQFQGYDGPVEIVWLPVGAQGPLTWAWSEAGELSVRCAGVQGSLGWITVVLPGEWVGARVGVDTADGALVIGDALISLGAGLSGSEP